MAAVKVTFTLEQGTAEMLRARARELAKPASQYVAALVQADARSARNGLAAEGYRELAEENLAFAEQSWATDNEHLPEWRE